MMKFGLAVIILAFMVPACQGAGLSFDAASATKNRPVTKVMTLLKDMLKQLEKEADEDEEIYDKIACWCETNDKEKTKSIKDAETRIKDLSTKIEELSAMSAKYATEIKNAKAEVAEDQESLDQATELRRKQLAEFNAEEKDMLESIAALKAAITVLSTHHGGAFLQVPHSHQLGVAATLQHEMQKHASLLQGVMTPSMKRAVATFIQSPEDYFDSSPTFKQSYAPQSGEIFGILTQMKETFEANLSQAQKDEMANQKAFEELKAAKEAEIKAGLDFIDAKTADLATAREKLAASKQDLEDTKASLNADEEFLMMLKDKCQMTDKEWEDRQKTRALEMEAVSKALAILSGDDAHDTFTRTFNPASFLQKESALNSQRRAQASKVLSTVAERLNRPKLAALAVQIRLDSFTKVKKAIDDLVAQLLKNKDEEIKLRDFCIDEFNKNQLQTEKKEDEKKDLIAKIEDLEMTIQQLTEAIETLEAEIEEMQVQLKRAGEDREKENKEFQMTVADQRETQKLLTAALKVLEGFYGKPAPMLVQAKQPVGPPPPPGFEEYKNSGASGDVMAMIAQIITDAKAMEAETIRSEADAQKAYEDFVKETNESIAAKQRDIVSKSEDKAKAESDLVETKEDKEGVMLELEDLSNYNAELHSECDFTLKNFELRQTSYEEEVEALRQAKAILSGAKFEEFLQGA